jgi:anti-anti-sigma factor
VSAPSSSFETTYLGSTGIVAVLGDVDIANAPEFGAAVDAVIERGFRLVVLDLSGTAFMDAAGLSVIATRAVLLAHLDGPLTVRSPSPLLARIISVTRLNAVTNVELRDI